MSDVLAGKTITVTTTKSLNVDEMADLIQATFKKTGCPTCTSGGHFVLREEAELAVSANARVTVT
jgi:hypothetical protein